MAELRIIGAGGSLRPRKAHRLVRHPVWRQAPSPHLTVVHLTVLRSIFTDPLPTDVDHRECTVATLFRTSMALNYLTGGARDMTFSARCHRAKRTKRWVAARAGWSVLCMAIDASCGVLRGESDHCATAWTNHVTRGRHTSL